MAGSGYFYWCGVVVTGAFLIVFLTGIGFSIKNWFEHKKEAKMREK